MPVRTAVINKPTNNKPWRGCGEEETLLHCWWECRLVQPLWKAVWRFVKKLKTDLPFDPVIPLLGTTEGTQNTNLKEHKHSYVHFSAMYNLQDMEAAQVSISGWVDKTTMGHLHNGILLSHKKEGNVILCNSMDGPGEHYAKWNKPVRERQIPCDFTHMWNLMNKIDWIDWQAK